MKKIFSIALLMVTALSFTGCVQEEDDIFDQSAAERLNAASTLYSKRLMAKPNGWAIQLYPTNGNEAPYGNGYLVLCRFHDDYSVDVAMRNELTGGLFKEATSVWQVITDNGPVLSFNTYNEVLHAFTNPEDIPTTGTPEEPKNETGVGIGGDYEFIIVDAPEDASYMMLKGKKRGTYNLLTPMEDNVDYESYLKDVSDFQNAMFPSNSPTFDVVYFGDDIYKMEDANDGIPNIYPYDGDRVVDESFNPFLVTKRGDDYYLRFRDEISIRNTEDKVQDFRYDAAKDIFVSVAGDQYYIDGDKPVRFFNSTLDTNEFSALQWKWTRSSELSAEMKSVLDNIDSQLRAFKYSFRENVLKVDNGRLILQLGYKSPNSTDVQYIDCYMASKPTEDGVELKFEGVDNEMKKMYDAVPAFSDLISLLSQQFVVTAATTKFNLRSVKLTSKANPDLWFVLNLK